MRRRKKIIREASGWVAFGLVLIWGVAEHNLQRQATVENTAELVKRAEWMRQQDKFREEIRAFVQTVLSRHENEDQIRSNEDIPDRFTGEQGRALERRIQALEAR